MVAISVKERIIQELDRLTLEQQEQLLAMAQRFRQADLPEGTPGQVLLEHLDRFNFAPGEVDEMMQAIEEECERIDWDGWR